MKTRAMKEKDLALLRGEFAEARNAFVVHFGGIKVVEVDELRRRVREAKGRYRVVRNRLAKKATEGTALAGVADHFTGPTAVVIVDGEVSRVAKALCDYAATNKVVSVKAGVVEGAALDAKACLDVANLPSREALVAKLAGLLNAPLQRLATVLSAPQRGIAVALGQVASKGSAE